MEEDTAHPREGTPPLVHLFFPAFFIYFLTFRTNCVILSGELFLLVTEVVF